MTHPAVLLRAWSRPIIGLLILFSTYLLLVRFYNPEPATETLHFLHDTLKPSNEVANLALCIGARGLLLSESPDDQLLPLKLDTGTRQLEDFCMLC